MQSVYLMGGNGFVGKRLAVRLKNIYKVFVFGRNIDEEFFSEYPEIVCHKIDLEKETIPEAYDCPDFIINLVSVVTAERNLSLFDRLVSSNLTVLLHLFERFRNDGRLRLFMQFGSIEEYGSCAAPFREDQREQPNSPYGLVKQLTTNTALMLYSNYGFPVSVIRPANLFGEGQSDDKFIPYILDRLRRSEPLDVSPCEQRREFLHVDDLADCITLLLGNYEQCAGKIINIGTGQSIKLRELIEFLKRELHSSSQVNYGALSYRANEAMDLRSSVERMSSILYDRNAVFDPFRKMLEKT